MEFNTKPIYGIEFYQEIEVDVQMSYKEQHNLGGGFARSFEH